MKLWLIAFALGALIAGCDRTTSTSGSANEGKAAQSAAGGSSNEGKALRSAGGGR